MAAHVLTTPLERSLGSLPGSAPTRMMSPRSASFVHDSFSPPLSLQPPMYIDPAAGSAIIQIGAAILLSTLAFAARVRQGVRTFFASVFTRRQH